jgi:beta-phosphoglucomutase
MPDRMGVIFDVDGVLVDSYHAHFDSWQIVARAEGFEFTERRFVDTFGRTTRDILREVLDSARATDSEIERLDSMKETAFREILSSNFPVMDGAKELIDACASAGFRLAVGSSGPPENVQLVLRSLGRQQVFQGVVNGMDVTRGKPDPQVFLLAAERLGLAPSRCVVIEDAPFGIEAAHRAGTKCIGFVSRGHTRDELRDADQRVDRLQEISPATIRELIGG